MAINCPTYVCSLFCVRDIARSRQFYETVMGQKVKYDFGANVSFVGGFAIHELGHFSGLIDGKKIQTGGYDAELYFEFEDIEAIATKITEFGLELLHAPREQPWRQLVFRFLDPDQHIVEIGESMEHVAYRLHTSGMDKNDVVAAIGMPLEFVQNAISLYGGSV